MQAATNVVVGGCFADGMAVCLNCDHWADQIANVYAKTNVVCHADSGWFLLIPTTLSCPNGCFDGVNFPSSWFNGVWKNGYEGHNASLSMHPACLADKKQAGILRQVAARTIYLAQKRRPQNCSLLTPTPNKGSLLTPTPSKGSFSLLTRTPSKGSFSLLTPTPSKGSFSLLTPTLNKGSSHFFVCFALRFQEAIYYIYICVYIYIYAFIYIFLCQGSLIIQPS